MSEPLRVEIAGVPLRCKHCEADVFHEVSAALDRMALGGVLLLEGAWGHRATIYVCSRCRFAHTFLGADPDRHHREVAEDVDCLSCGRSIPTGASSCPSCGWSWESEASEPA